MIVCGFASVRKGGRLLISWCNMRQILPEAGGEIVRYDCAHGFLHRDVMLPKGKTEKQPLSIANLSDALQYAEQDIKDRWQWYKERYIKGLRK
jgi:hypothetical protein